MPAYVPGYRNDIFVSYARVDDALITGIELGWVSHVIETLEIILAQLIGRDDGYHLWMDKMGKRPARITPDILREVKHSATLLVILSPGYIASDWCQDELNCFADTVTESDPCGVLKRIFVIEKIMRRVKRPAILEENIPYPLWYEDQNKRPRTLGSPQFRPDETDYYNLDAQVFSG